MRLQCPSCANIIDAAPATTPRCPACGFMGAVTTGPPAFVAAPAALPPPGQGPQARPGWVVAVVILQCISGGLAILGGLALVFFGAVFGALMSAFFGPLGAFGALFALLGVVIVAFGVLYVLLAMQVLKGRPWARVLSIVLASVSAAFQLLGLFSGDPFALFSIAFEAVIIVGLCLPETRAWFAQQDAASRPRHVPA